MKSVTRRSSCSLILATDVHRANQAISAVHFVVHGRLKQSVVDMHSNVLLQRFLTRGSQFGALGAAQSDPVPVDVVAVEPSAVLKLDFETTLRFTRKYETFGLNLTHSIAGMVREVLLPDRQPKKPTLVTVFHASRASRPLTRQLIQRLLELGETPCVMSDGVDWDPIDKRPLSVTPKRWRLPNAGRVSPTDQSLVRFRTHHPRR